MNSSPTDLTAKIASTLDDVAKATVAALRAAAQAHYMAALARAAALGTKAPTPAHHMEWTKLGYDAVITLLPKESPFIDILQTFKEHDVNAHKNPPGPETHEGGHQR